MTHHLLTECNANAILVWKFYKSSLFLNYKKAISGIQNSFCLTRAVSSISFSSSFLVRLNVFEDCSSTRKSNGLWHMGEVSHSLSSIVVDLTGSCWLYLVNFLNNQLQCIIMVKTALFMVWGILYFIAHIKLTSKWTNIWTDYNEFIPIQGIIKHKQKMSLKNTLYKHFTAFNNLSQKDDKHWHPR